MSKKKLMALLLTGVMAASTVSVPVFAEEAEGGSSDTPLVIGQTNFSEKFSGLFHETVPDQQIAYQVQSRKQELNEIMEGMQRMWQSGSK